MLATKTPNKKMKREHDKQNRVLVTFNTGTRIHKNKKKTEAIYRYEVEDMPLIVGIDSKGGNVYKR